MAKVDIRKKRPLERSVDIVFPGGNDDGSDQIVSFRFRSIGRKAYDGLIDAHPPKEQGAGAYDIETFAPALIAASCIEPQISAEDAQFIFDEWSAGEINALFRTAVAVNARSSIDPFGSESIATSG